MSSWEDREHGFENKFAHDEELKFKAMAKRDKLLGLWVAEKIGKTGEDANAYAVSVVMADFEEVGEEDVFRKIRQDLPATVSDTEIRSHMYDLMIEAVSQIQKG
jgi:hypothetical protein